jgi:asparagine synthase (glutamine-hydrolysing)
LTLVSRPEHQAQRARVFRSGVSAFLKAKARAPSATIETDWASIATFARLNGSGTPVLSDAATGSWLIGLGTWFHRDGLQSGEEARLLQRYLEVGSDGLARELEGFFAIVIGDGRSREVFTVTDIVGSCHCYARSWANGKALSNSSFALAALEKTSLDPVGCQEFLRTGSMYEDRTFYLEVKKLGPAAIHRMPAEGPRSEIRYWSMGRLSPDRLQGADAVARLNEDLVRAAGRVGAAFPKPVCDLTGGYDSRAVVSSFLKAGVSFETVVTGPPESPDVTVARDLARLAGLRHTHINTTEPVTWEQAKRAFTVTDGEYDLVEYGRVFRNHEELLRRYDISINGSFGEVARGYWWELLLPNVGARRALDARRVAAGRYAAAASHSLLFPPDSALDLVSHFAGIIQRANEGLASFPNTFQMDHTYLTLRMQRWQGRIASSTDQLWPCLSPFMFRSVLETMLQVRARDRRGSALVRRLLVALYPPFATFPLEHGYPPLPVTWRTLHRFWPVPIYYGKRVLAKVLPARPAPASAGANSGPPRVRFAPLDEVRDLMRPAEMRLGGLLGDEALTRFFGSPGAGGSYEQTWTRVLSLEYTLRALERFGVSDRGGSR